DIDIGLETIGRAGCGLYRALHRLAAAPAGEGVRVSRINDECARYAMTKMLPAPIDRSRRGLGLRQNTGDGGAGVEQCEEQIGAAGIADAGSGGCNAHPLNGRKFSKALRRERRNFPHGAYAKRSLLSAGIPLALVLRQFRQLLAIEHAAIHRLLEVGIDYLDLRSAAQAGHNLLRLLLHELSHDRFLDLIETRQWLVALLLDLDDVPAELSLHRIGDLADLERKGGILERLQHGATGEEAEITAFGVRVLRFLLGDRGEVLALLQPLLNLLGLR